MKEFVGIRAKTYSLGLKKYVILKHLKHSDFRNCLFECREYLHAMNSIRSQKHAISMRQNKTTLSAYDDKFYMLEDGISTLPYGHYKTRQWLYLVLNYYYY